MKTGLKAGLSEDRSCDLRMFPSWIEEDKVFRVEPHVWCTTVFDGSVIGHSRMYPRTTDTNE